MKDHNAYIHVDSDKNMGPAVGESDLYGTRVCTDFLGNEQNYEQLTPQRAANMQRGLQYQFLTWYARYWSEPSIRPDQTDVIPISKAEHTFLVRAMATAIKQAS